jgi:uncharacterized repeat protein (TIGR03803 family)
MGTTEFRSGRISVWATLGTLMLVLSTYASAQTELVLHSFGGGTDGKFLYAGVVADSVGNLYGTTGYGGTYGYGTVYELRPGAGGNYTEKILHSFSCNGTDGCWPITGLAIDASGNLFGMTSSGGTNDSGIVFEMAVTPEGRVENIIHNFADSTTDGRNPVSYSLTLDAAGNVYGTTQYGGANGEGTVFELKPASGSTWTETLLYSFGQAFSGDGNNPRSSLAWDSHGNLYGTTLNGGVYDDGTVFELSPSGSGTWTESLLYSFCALTDCSDGADPGSTLALDAAGNVYGTTDFGGVFENGHEYGGVLFELSPSASGTWTETVLHDFGSGTDGYLAGTGVVFDSAGNLYGTTSDGGTYSAGTLFELSPASGSWSETVLFNFGKNGSSPAGPPLIAADGSLYGATGAGGADRGGIAFRVNP